MTACGDCEFEIYADVPGWLYCPTCERYQRGTSTELRRACRPEIETHKDPPVAGGGLPPSPRPPGGPGTKLTKLLKEFDLTERIDCGCKAFAKRMDRWGIAGCNAHRGEIIEKLKHSAAHRSWAEKLIVGGKLAQTAWWSPLDPYGSIADEAIRRAESFSAEWSLSTD